MVRSHGKLAVDCILPIFLWSFPDTCYWIKQWKTKTKIHLPVLLLTVKIFFGIPIPFVHYVLVRLYEATLLKFIWCDIIVTFWVKFVSTADSYDKWHSWSVTDKGYGATTRFCDLYVVTLNFLFSDNFQNLKSLNPSRYSADFSLYSSGNPDVFGPISFTRSPGKYQTVEAGVWDEKYW